MTSKNTTLEKLPHEKKYVPSIRMEAGIPDINRVIDIGKVDTKPALEKTAPEKPATPAGARHMGAIDIGKVDTKPAPEKSVPPSIPTGAVLLDINAMPEKTTTPAGARHMGAIDIGKVDMKPAPEKTATPAGARHMGVRGARPVGAIDIGAKSAKYENHVKSDNLARHEKAAMPTNVRTGAGLPSNMEAKVPNINRVIGAIEVGAKPAPEKSVPPSIPTGAVLLDINAMPEKTATPAGARPSGVREARHVGAIDIGKVDTKPALEKTAPEKTATPAGARPSGVRGARNVGAIDIGGVDTKPALEKTAPEKTATPAGARPSGVRGARNMGAIDIGAKSVSIEMLAELTRPNPYDEVIKKHNKNPIKTTENHEKTTKNHQKTTSYHPFLQEKSSPLFKVKDSNNATPKYNNSNTSNNEEKDDASRLPNNNILKTNEEKPVTLVNNNTSTQKTKNKETDENISGKNKHAQLSSYVTSGISASRVNIEVAISAGISKFEIIGLGDTAIKESKERIIKAITQSGYSIPAGNITVNLAPAKTRKKGSLYDLPIALALLIASKQITCAIDITHWIIAGELSLKGNVAEVDGLFATIVKILKTKKSMNFLVPLQNFKDCAPFIKNLNNTSDAGVYEQPHDLQFCMAESLKEAIEALENNTHKEENDEQNLLKYQKIIHEQKQEKIEYQQKLPNTNSHNSSGENNNYANKHIGDYAQVLGQENAKLALQLAASAGLNVLFVGPPGCGKSMLMRRLPSILPPLDADDALELTLIEHAYGMKQTQINRNIPFREAHSNIPVTSLIGGGRNPKPGEISLAHNGFLFLDEISLFSNSALQSLRTPIEEKSIVINRLAESVQYPANFSLLACCNPCPCGFFGDKRKMCKCTRRSTQKFFEKLSRPFIDRFHIILYINKIEQKDLYPTKEISSQVMKEAVYKANLFAKKNYNKLLNVSIKTIVEEYPLLKEFVTKALKHNILSLRRIEAMVKVLMALMNHYQTSTFDKKMILQAMELSSNKLLNLE